jgi:hypothetical protein
MIPTQVAAHNPKKNGHEGLEKSSGKESMRNAGCTRPTRHNPSLANSQRRSVLPSMLIVHEFSHCVGEKFTTRPDGISPREHESRTPFSVPTRTRTIDSLETVVTGRFPAIKSRTFPKSGHWLGCAVKELKSFRRDDAGPLTCSLPFKTGAYFP